MLDEELRNILLMYMKDFEIKRRSEVVVKNSIPVVWFGDIEQYLKSPKRIVTVALNPSLKEFPEGLKRFQFPIHSEDELYNTLNDYFENNPYKTWFNSFERCLNYFDASYGGQLSEKDYTNTAINIDACSSIASNPTWGKLTAEQQNEISQYSLFKNLLEYLKPNVILMSVAKSRFLDILGLDGESLVFVSDSGKLGAYIKNKQIMIYGRNLKGTPFGGINKTEMDLFFNFINKF